MSDQFSPDQLRKIKEAAEAFEHSKEVWKKDKIEVFEQLLKLKAFTEWAGDNIIVNRDVNHLSREILITVIYKGEYGGNKTSLQRLEEIKELICTDGAIEDTKLQGMTKEELAAKIFEVIDFDVTRATPLEDIITEKEGEPGEETN